MGSLECDVCDGRAVDGSAVVSYLNLMRQDNSGSAMRRMEAEAHTSDMRATSVLAARLQVREPFYLLILDEGMAFVLVWRKCRATRGFGGWVQYR